MDEIVKNCRVHGQLTSENITKYGACKFCCKIWNDNYNIRQKDKTLVKTCLIHGHLTESQVRRRKPPRKEIVCKQCESDHHQKWQKSGSEKAVTHAKRYRYFERSSNTKELECCHCKKIKLIQFFNKHAIKLRYPHCAECRRNFTRNTRNNEEFKIRQRKYRIKNSNYELKSHLKRKYGLALNDYKLLIEIQNNLCAICNKPETRKVVPRSKNTLNPTEIARLCVDHDHLNGSVRGLLCYNCNSGLGQFKDNKELLRNAIEYLEFHEKNS